MSAQGGGNGRSLLLIFSAIDLLCSALVSAVVLLVVLVGGSGSTAGSKATTDGGAGVTMIEAWLPADDSLTIERTTPLEVGKVTPTGFVKDLLPNATVRKFYTLSPEREVARLKVRGRVVLNVFGGMGDSLQIVIDCQEQNSAFVLKIYPAIRLPACKIASPNRQLASKGWTISLSLEAIDAVASLSATGGVKRVGASGRSNVKFYFDRDVRLPVGAGIWALTL